MMSHPLGGTECVYSQRLFSPFVHPLLKISAFLRQATLFFSAQIVFSGIFYSRTYSNNITLACSYSPLFHFICFTFNINEGDKIIALCKNLKKSDRITGRDLENLRLYAFSFFIEYPY